MALTRAFHNQIITKTYVSYFWSLIQFQNFTAVYGLNQFELINRSTKYSEDLLKSYRVFRLKIKKKFNL